MFKRIVKVSGIVLLCFALLIGGVVAFMAIRGDFKKKSIKPTSISFSITKTDLVLDASVTDKPTLDNGRVFSFTITAEPLDVTVTECTIKLSSPLITFVEWSRDKSNWVKYESNKFYLNRPIYFIVNNVVDDTTDKTYVIDEDDYSDGILEITVKDKSGLLQDTIELEIDRSITSISFKDNWNEKNNKIEDGMFGYEIGQTVPVEQVLDVIEGEDCPLQVITAPLMASKPFNSKEEKLYEIYYVKNEQPQLLIHYEDVVKLERYNDEGNRIEESCDFLRYDTVNNNYVFNSSSSGDFKFILATYPTYKIQEEILSKEMSFVERLQQADILTKSVVISVKGTDAEQISFEGDNTSIGMKLLQDNQWIVNNGTTLDKYDLGLTLSKLGSGTEIVGRYNELKFLNKDEHFLDNVDWTFKKAKITTDPETGKDVVNVDKNSQVAVNFKIDRFGNRKATVDGLDEHGVDSGVTFDVRLIMPEASSNYNLILTSEEKDGEIVISTTTITFTLYADPETGKELSFDSNKTDENKVFSISINKDYPDDASKNLSLNPNLVEDICDCTILGDYDKENETYTFKTLKSGLYLTLLGVKDSKSKYELINDEFITNIIYDGANSIITVKPIKSDLLELEEIRLYAVVVNENGSWAYTENSRQAVVKADDTILSLNNDGNLGLPVIVVDSSEGFEWGNGVDVEDLVGIKQAGAYTSILMFVPEYSLLTMETAPAEWGNGLQAYDNTWNPIDTSSTDYVKNTYYTKNNYKTIDIVSVEITDNAGKSYPVYLMGYMDGDDFVNKVVPTGFNYYSQLYPVIVKSEYIINESRLQTAEEYIEQLLSNKKATSITKSGEEITYDLGLLVNGFITKTATYFIKTTGAYNETKEYYIWNSVDTRYELASELSQDIIDNWAEKKGDYFEKVDAIKAETVLGDTSKINSNLTYYKVDEARTLYDATIYNGSTDFVNNWSNYYIIISHYVIESVEKGTENITFSAHAYSDNRKTNNAQTFVISVSDYNDDLIDEDLGVSKFYIDASNVILYDDEKDRITATSYYDFSKSSVKPTGEFGGDYFNENNKVSSGDATIYEVVAGHKGIELGWDGTTTDQIKNKTVKTSLYIDHKANEVILNNIINNLYQINAIEYDETNDNVATINDKIGVSNISIGYEVASPVRVDGMKYYDLAGNDDTTDAMSETNWSETYKNYYVKAIVAEVVVNDTISDGHYVKIEWTYLGDGVPYKAYSPKLIISSQEVTGYNIDVGKVLYTNNTGTNEAIYTDEVYYEIEVGYEGNNYKYVVYVTDTDGNRLYNNEGDIISGSADTAFKLKSKGGWIASKPKYAKSAEFEIEGNSKIKFNYDETDKVNNLTFVQITDGFTDIYLQSVISAGVNTAIKVKVTQDGKFEQVSSGEFNKNSPSKEKTLQLPQKLYTYNGEDISNKLELEITKFTIDNAGQDESELYTVIYDEGVYKIVDIATGEKEQLSLKYNDDEKVKSWVITRNNYNNITLDIRFVSIIETTEPIHFEFKSPYTIKKSTSNKTTVIYSETNFALASTTEGNALYYIDNNAIKIKYIDLSELSSEELEEYNKQLLKLSSNDLLEKYKDNLKEAEIDSGLWIIKNIPQVIKSTNYVFNLIYNEDVVGTFVLTISPNILITADTEEFIKLDDLNNNEYDFSNLKISEYDTSVEYYTNYTDNIKTNLKPITNLSGLDYVCYTYLDSEFEVEYTTNVVEPNNNKLNVISPISKVGTYYVKVTIIRISDGVVVGEVNFEITTKSNIANEQNQDIDPIEVTAKTSKPYSQTDLQKMFKLTRDGVNYYPVKYIETAKYVDGETYQYNNTSKKFELLSSEPTTTIVMYTKNNDCYVAGITFKLNDSGIYESVTSTNEDIQYYHKFDLTDILWINTTNECIEFTYNYDGKTLTQKVEYNEYTAEWVAGEQYYYLDNGVYTLATEKKEDVTYYTRTQQLIYNDGTATTYKLIGTTHNMDEHTYDIYSGKFIKSGAEIDDTREIGKNIVYYVEATKSIIYCKQNAYLFVNIANSNDILALSIEDNGKVVYKFNATESSVTETTNKANELTTIVNKIKDDTKVSLGEIVSLELNYNGYGKDLANKQYVDTIEYSAELVFNTKYNIKTDDIYNIYVTPYTISPKANVVLNKAYTLYNSEESASETDLFYLNGDTNIKKIEFNSSEDYSILTSGGKKTITFNADGNSYTTYIPVTLTYSNNLTYNYNVEITVLNSVAVGVEYPYNVEKGVSSYNTFNASITEFVKSVDNLYDENDFAMWLGTDTSVDNWKANTRVKYDLALKGDKIDLTEDNLRNVVRYNQYKFEKVVASDTFSVDTYYVYNTATKALELLTTEPTDWTNANIKCLKYFKRTSDTSAQIGKIELVAVSSTYANNLTNIVDSLALNGNTITISTSLNQTGYAVFKVYAGDSGAYGYYVLKIVDDEQFEDTIGFSSARNSQTIADKLSLVKITTENESKYPYEANKYYDASGTLIDATEKPAEYYRYETIIEFIRNSGHDIGSVGYISNDLINSDNSNVFMFMVNKNNANGDIASIKQGQLISNDTILVLDANVQDIEVAVVIQSGTSLVHVCNYKIIVQVDVSIYVDDLIKVEDANTYKYSTELEYKYSGSNEYDFSKTILDDGYITITGNGDQPTRVEFDAVEAKSEGISFDTTNGDIKYTYIKEDGTEVTATIASINGAKLTLNAPVGEELHFYLKLLNGLDFEVSLKVTLKPFKFKSTTQFTIGNLVGSSFNNKLDLTEVFGDYNLNYKYSINNGSESGERTANTEENKKLELPSDLNNTTYTVEVTLTSVVPQISKIIIVNVKSNINAKYNDAYEGYSQNATRVEPTKVTPGVSDIITEVGSQLLVDINSTDKTIKIKDSSKDYLTINVGAFTSVNFSLTSDTGEVLAPDGKEDQPYYYFVGPDGVELDRTFANTNLTDQPLNFVHSAQNVNMRLNVTVYNYTGDYYKVEFTKAGTGDIPAVDTYYDATGKLISSSSYNGDYYTVNAELINEDTEKQAYPFKTNKYYELVDSSYELITTGNYTTSYPLFITLPETYTLESAYRVTSAGYETVVNGSNLTLKADTDNDISEHFFGTDANAGIRGTANGLDVKVNQSRVQIRIKDVTTAYGGYDNLKGLGLLTEHNPNKLNYDLAVMAGTTMSSIDSGILTFRSDTSGTDNTLILSNATTTINYQFKIFGEEDDYSQIAYNDNLLQIAKANGELDYISIPYSDFFDLEGNKVALNLGYLKYLPNNEGLIGLVYETSGKLTFGFNAQTGSAEYGSKIEMTATNLLTENVIHEIEVIVITLNGLAGKVNLVISNFEAEYCYGTPGENYESVYAGTQIGKFSDTVNTSPRLNVKVNDTNSYTLDYIGAVNGNISHWYMGVAPDYATDDTTLVSYDSSKGVLASRSVARNTYVTMMFNVIDNETSLIVGRIYYNLMLQNNIKIGLNTDLDINNAIDLYLGSDIYKINPSDNTETVIDLLQSENGGNYNNLYVTLEQYSTNNIIGSANKALYNGTNNSALSVADDATRNVSQYLHFSITNKTGDCADNEIVRVDNATGKLYIKGNPSGSFVLNVFSANGTGYGESYTINLHKYDNTTTPYSEQINRNGGAGFASGTTLYLFNDIVKSGITNSNYAFTTYRESYNKPQMEKLNILNNGDIDVKYQIGIFDYGTTVAEIKNSANWSSTSTSTAIEYGTGNTPNTVYTNGAYEILFPKVGYSENLNEKEYQIVSVRLTITYNGDENEYFAHYLVYNEDSVTINARYATDKTIKYCDSIPGAWQDGATVTIMDIANTGMYSALTLVNTSTAPADWTDGTGIYYKKDIDDTGKETGTYIRVNTLSPDNPYKTGTYYKFNSIIDGLKKYTKLTSSTAPAYWPDDYYAKVDNEYIRLSDLPEDPQDYVPDTYYKLEYNYVLLTDENAPTDWSTGTYYKKDDDDYQKVETGTIYAKDKYYKLGNNENYTMWMQNGNDTAKQIFDLGVEINSDATSVKLIGRLPANLFTNKADIKFIIKSNEGTVLFEEAWNMKAGTTIESKSSKLLRDFFLTSEISNQDYYNTSIIGLIDSWDESDNETIKGFVTTDPNYTTVSGSKVIETLVSAEECEYSLWQLTYTYAGYNTGSPVCTVETNEYYILVGHNNVISLDFNGGDYYINATIDDSKFTDTDKTTANINLKNFVTVWGMNDGEIAKVDITGFEIGKESGSGYVTIHSDKSTAIVSNVNKLTTNPYAGIEIKSNDVSRTIEVYFNIIINAKDLDINGDGTPDGIMPFNEMLHKAMEIDLANTAQDTSSVGKLTSDEIDDNLTLKRELLSLIKFNGQNVLTDSTTLSYYSIEVTRVETNNYYNITYTYNNGVSSYTRELKILDLMNAKSVTDNVMAYNASLKTAMDADGNKTLTNNEISEDLKKMLLNLVQFDGVNIDTSNETVVGCYSLEVKSVAEKTYYNITYTYNNGTINYTKTLKISNVAPAS